MLVDLPESSNGDWIISKFEIPNHPTLISMSLAFDGRHCAPGTYTKLTHAKRGIIMSDTTAEQRDHKPFIREARGHCLINGLGIGMCLNAVLKINRVDFVTVIEIDKDLIDLVSPHYYHDKCDIVHASAFDYVSPKGVRYGAVWHDIWDSICQDNYEEMKQLHRKYGRKADWQGSWGRPEIERMNRTRW